MYIKCHAQRVKGNTYKIHLWDDEEGYQEILWDNEAYKECSYETQEYTGLNGEPLVKVKEWWRDDKGLHFHDMPPYQKFLIEKYGTDSTVSKGHKEMFFDIETEMMEEFTPEYLKSAPKMITSIAWWDKQEDDWAIIILDTNERLEELLKDKDFDNKRVIIVDSEEKLLARFVQEWRDIDPDIVVGWNCIPENSSVWTDQGIVPIKRIRRRDNLERVNDQVLEIQNTGKKLVYETHLENGQMLKSSADHIFPIALEGDDIWNNFKDFKVWDASKIEGNKYFELNRGYNKMSPLTYENLGGKGGKIKEEDLYLLGLVYTDGRYFNIPSERSAVVIDLHDLELIENVMPLVNKQRRKIHELSMDNFPPFRPMVSQELPRYRFEFSRFNNNKKFDTLRPLITEFDLTSYNNELNLNLLSRLSNNQFKAFFEGLLDGNKGEIDNGVKIRLEKEENIKLHELLLWNGVYSNLEEDGDVVNVLPKDIFGNINFLNSLNLLSSKKEIELSSIDCDVNLPKYFTEDKALLKIQEITTKGETCVMWDLTTENGYFIYNGIRTHNCDFFDIPYLYWRMVKIIGPELTDYLSPINYIQETPWFDEHLVRIAGVEVLDYMKLHQKYGWQDEPSWKLDDIGERYVDLRKIEYEGTLDDLFRDDPERFIEYNFRDVEILKELDSKWDYLSLTRDISHKGKHNYSEVYYSTKTHDGAISAYLLSQNIIPPPKEREPHRDYAGGYLFCPKAGVYRYMYDQDLTSLYPSIIMSLNIGKETYMGRIVNEDPRNKDLGLQDLREMDPDSELTIESRNRSQTVVKVNELIEAIVSEKLAISANGVMFRTDKPSLLSIILSGWFDERVGYQKKMNEAFKRGDKAEGQYWFVRQLAQKILLNSLYGALAVTGGGFRYGAILLAEAITLSGHKIITYSARVANDHINEEMRKLEQEGVKSEYKPWRFK